MTTKAILQKLQKQRRCCTVATVGGFRPPENPLTSWFGGNFLSAPGDPWPTTSNGPMIPLLQVAAADVAAWPASLRDYSIVQVFIDRASIPVHIPVESGDGWLFRGYRETSLLVRATDPAPHLRPFPIRWRCEEGDSPSWEELGALLESDEVSVLASDMGRYFTTFHFVQGTKLGGWPSYIQGGPLVGHEFVLQIASEGKSGWAWGDAGNGYIFRSRDGSWLLYWDCF